MGYSTMLPVMLLLMAFAHVGMCADVDHEWVYQCPSDHHDLTYVHMSTVAELPNATLAVAWQGSKYHEGCNDQNIYFKTSKPGFRTWNVHSTAVSVPGFAVWGPVLHYNRSTGVLTLFFSQSGPEQGRKGSDCPSSVGQSYPGGSIRITHSTDLGVTWAPPRTILPFSSGNVSKVTANLLLVSRAGEWILPFWQEPHTSFDTGPGCAGVLISADAGASWERFACIASNATWLIENSIAQLSSGAFFQVFRTSVGHIYTSTSTDARAWTPAQPTDLLNPNSKTCLTPRPNSSEIILAFNPSKDERNPLDLAVTTDGSVWRDFVRLDSAESKQSFAYPTPLVVGNQIVTTYSALGNTGIKMAITALPP